MQTKTRAWTYLLYRLCMLLQPYWLEGKKGGALLARAVIETSEEIHPDDASTNGTMRFIRNDWLRQLRTGFNECIDREIE